MAADDVDACIDRRIEASDGLARAVHALVRYGSFERGDFVPGLSDLDYFAVVDTAALGDRQPGGDALEDRSDRTGENAPEDGHGDQHARVRTAVVEPLEEILRACAEPIDHRGVDLAWEYRRAFEHPDAGIPFKFLTVYREDFRRHHAVVYGVDVTDELPSVDRSAALSDRLDRLAGLAEEHADDPEALRFLAGETARLRALLDGADSLRKDDVLAALEATDRTDALRVYRTYLEDGTDALPSSFLREYVADAVAAMHAAVCD